MVRSRSGVRVRLTEKQWEHIVAARPELGGFRREVLEAVEHPDEVYEPPARVRPQLHAVKRFIHAPYGPRGFGGTLLHHGWEKARFHVGDLS